MALELYRCESPDCEYVTENPQADRCPLCGGTFFVKAEEGEVTPKGWLGLCREADRDGRQPDAYAFCRRGAETGDPACLCEQARRLLTGRGTAVDKPAAVALLDRAAAGGDPEGQCLLGVCHEHGDGVPADPESAVFLYRQAADRSYAPAQCNLGWCYEHGRGLPRPCS